MYIPHVQDDRGPQGLYQLLLPKAEPQSYKHHFSHSIDQYLHTPEPHICQSLRRKIKLWDNDSSMNM